MSWLSSSWLEGGLRDAQRRFWLRGATRLGRGGTLDGRPFIDNQGGELVLGDDVFLGSVPVQSHLVVGRGAELLIGNEVQLSYGAALSAFASVRIGDRARIGPFVVVMDSDFHVAGDRNAHAEAKPITIGPDVVIESRVTILRGSTIGAGARIRSGSVVSGQIAAGVVAAGVPAGVWVGGEGAMDVQTVAMKALGLRTLPMLEDGPDQIAEWDSFGALKLLLALEKSFGVTIREEQMKSAHSISDLSAIVENARRGARPRH